MKCSESWLSEWVSSGLPVETLSSVLTMAGLEVEGVENGVIDISITPNRGDCLSIRGIAREISALTRSPLKAKAIPAVAAVNKDSLPVHIEAKSGCPRYVGRVIRNVKANAESPAWLKDRLEGAGLKTISPVVDVMNYVMLELGQPMHAFDLNTIDQCIKVRLSVKGEKIALLDDSEKELDGETLIIADQHKPLAIAGVMGGLASSVTSTTRDVFLESAYFTPAVIARQRQFYNLNSDSAYRFERGVDSTIQLEAIERATQLILEVAGGEPGVIVEEASIEHLPKACVIPLKPEKVTQLLGVSIPKQKVESIFDALQFKWKEESQQWHVNVPAYRFDMSIPEDVIEEIARIYGYNEIPESVIKSDLKVNRQIETSQDLQLLRQVISDQGLYEIISYSFIDKKLQALFDPEEQSRELMNPMTAEMEVMRTNLLPGLVNTYLYNKSRQQNRIRLFEIGTCFVTRDKAISEQSRVAGLISGAAFKEQWGVPAREVDFYDLKGAIDNIIGLSYPKNELVYRSESHPALHPGQSAGIYHQDIKIGVMGALHPAILQSLDVSGKVFVFELDLHLLTNAGFSLSQEISKFPEIRRDLAILVNQTVPAKDIQDTIRLTVGDWLKDVFIFDVYQGKGIEPGYKSIALALILQHPTRTLVDQEVADLMDRTIEALKGRIGAKLRS